MRSLLKLVARRIRATSENAFEIEEELDDRIANLYNLTLDERRMVGIRR